MLEIMNYDEWVELQRNVYSENIVEVENEEYDKLIKEYIRKELNSFTFDNFFDNHISDLSSGYEPEFECEDGYGVDEVEQSNCEMCIGNYNNCEFLDHLESLAIEYYETYKHILCFKELDEDGEEILTPLKEIYENQVLKDKRNIKEYEKTNKF